MKTIIYFMAIIASSLFYTGCKQQPNNSNNSSDEHPAGADVEQTEQDAPVVEEVKDVREKVVDFSHQVLKTMFAKDCDAYKSHLADPFLFLSEGFVEVDMYANEFCNEFDLFNKAGVTFEEYLENNQIDIYKTEELDSVYDENNKILNFKEYLDEAIKKEKIDYTFGENDFLVIGFRPKEGKTPINVNKDRLHFFVKKLEDGSFIVSGVFN